jgi:hypothetical protein
MLSSALGALVTVVLAGGAARADEAPWRGDGVTDGVQVERRDVKGSHFDELRLSLLSNVSVERLCDAIYPKALPAHLERHFKKQELLRETPTDRVTYEQISVPVFSDRDYVVHTRLEIPGSTGRCAVSFFTEEDPAHPPVDGFVRIPVIRGHWDVFPVEGGKVSVQYRIFSEPGGGVPAFLSRGSQKSTAIDFMKLILARASTPGSAAASH